MLMLHLFENRNLVRANCCVQGGESLVLKSVNMAYSLVFYLSTYS